MRNREKFREGITEKNIIVKCGADRFLPFALVFGFYIILFGTISPGGGFQGGVCVAAAVLLLYLGYGYDVVRRVINPNVLRFNEALGAALYVILGLAGLTLGLNFCTNIFSDSGQVGDMLSGGTVTFMGYAVGFKVLCGVGYLILLMLSLLAPTGKAAIPVSGGDDGDTPEDGSGTVEQTSDAPEEAGAKPEMNVSTAAEADETAAGKTAGKPEKKTGDAAVKTDSTPEKKTDGKPEEKTDSKPEEKAKEVEG